MDSGTSKLSPVLHDFISEIGFEPQTSSQTWHSASARVFFEKMKNTCFQ
jgi:hypothetical protein